MREYHIITAAASPHRQAWRRPFTMVELMVVIVIAGIILAFAVPAFQKLAVGGGVDAAARMVSSQLSLARAEAISRRQHIAVIMPGARYARSSDDDSVHPFQSFRSAVVEPSSSGSAYTFVNWVEGTEWTFLPAGTVIASVSTTENALQSVHSDPGDSSSPLITIPRETWSPNYSSTGEAVADAAPYMNGATANTHNVRAVIFRPNGRCTQRFYVTIMEGAYSEVALNEARTEPERTVLTNIRVMEVNAFTGQIRYLF
ncbi:MAG: pilus assembly FimT family protein [Lentisphaeria bacterium]|jgi:prepilin-type N-terminal cleavage/methylation domain-containing protein